MLLGLLLTLLLAPVGLARLRRLGDTNEAELALLGGVPSCLEVLLLLGEPMLLAGDNAAVFVVHEVLLRQAPGGAIFVPMHNFGAGAAGCASLAMLRHLIEQQKKPNAVKKGEGAKRYGNRFGDEAGGRGR